MGFRSDLPARTSTTRAHRARLVGVVCGTYVLLGGLITFAGWAADMRAWTDWIGNGISMQPNASIAASAAGLGIVLLARGRGGPLVSVLGTIAGFLGAATLLEYVLTIDLGIDRVFMFGRTWGRVGTAVPGRMGPPGSLCWTLLGLALVGTRGERPARRLSPMLGLVVTGVAAMSVTGYLYGAGTLYTLPRLTTIAFQTATILLAAGIGLLAAMPNREPVRTLLDNGSAASAARRMLPFLVMVPIALGYLRLIGQTRGLYDTAMGSALLVLALIAVICIVLWWGTAAVNRNERVLVAANAARDRARLELFDTESRVAATLESISDGFMAFDSGWRITYVNGEAERVLNSTRAELLGQVLWERFPGLVGSAVHAAMVKAAAERTVEEVEDRNGRRDRWFSNRIYPTSDGVSVYFRDITDQRLASERAFKSEQQARTLIRFLPGGAAFVIDRDLRYLLADGEAMQSTGLRSQDFVGRTIFEALDPESAASHEPMLRAALTGLPFVHEHDAMGRSYVSRGVPLRNERGEIYAVLVFSHDITDRKLTETALKEADRRKDAFLATLAHELRNPLAPITNALEIIRHAAHSPDMVNSARATMERQVRHMVRLIDDLMDVSRITRDRLELRTLRVDLAVVLQHAVENAEPMTRAAGHELATTLPPEPMWLEGDPARLTQVFGNLLANASRYTDSGGRIDVTARVEGSRAVVSVSDTGIGIPVEQLEAIFEPFVQVDQSIERRYGGLGIGLSLVRRLVALHGGSVRAQSAGAGQGSTFTVRLPLVSASHDARATDVAETPRADLGQGAHAGGDDRAAGPSPSRRVLVVDDNRDAALSLATLLDLEGFRTAVAHDGVHALQCIADFVPDVVLLDIGLPGMSGYDVCRAIRATPAGKSMQLVALTGWGQTDDRRQSQEAGFDAHLVKPVEHAALLETLNTGSRKPKAGSP